MNHWFKIMKIPKNLKFLGHIITVKQVKEISDPEYEGSRGIYNFKKGIIEIERGLSQTNKEDVLFHEIAEMLAHWMEMEYREVCSHDGFKRYISLLWTILKDNDLLK